MKSLLTLSVLLYFISCSDNTGHHDRKDGYTPVLKTKEDSLYQQVIHGHDIGMAKMGRIRKYLKQIQQELDSLNKLPEKSIDENYQQALIELQEDLNYADHSMYTWMNEFKADTFTNDKAKRLGYLESEKIKVEKVKENILNGLQRADSLLGK
jgi:hypothetical protein